MLISGGIALLRKATPSRSRAPSEARPIGLVADHGLRPSVRRIFPDPNHRAGWKLAPIELLYKKLATCTEMLKEIPGGTFRRKKALDWRE